MVEGLPSKGAIVRLPPFNSLLFPNLPFPSSYLASDVTLVGLLSYRSPCGLMSAFFGPTLVCSLAFVACVPYFALPGELAKFPDILQRCQMTADVNKTDGAGQTPLHKAAEKCPDKCIMTLLNKSADIDARNTLGATPAATFFILPFNQPVLDAQELTALRSDLDLMRAPA